MLARLLALSDLHFYLTTPFVLSWSCLNAMACGATMLCSDTAPVREVISDGENGLLCDFFDDAAFADRALEVLADPEALPRDARRCCGGDGRRALLARRDLPSDHVALRGGGGLMHPFWEQVIRPLLDASRPDTVVEIGAERGYTTMRLLGWAAPAGAIVHSIDPTPRFDVARAELEHGERLRFHRETSLTALSHIGAVDAALIDGDHNWHTVSSELDLLAEAAAAAEKPLPLVLAHDAGWPYGRRDMYYDPASDPSRAPPRRGASWNRTGPLGARVTRDQRRALERNPRGRSSQWRPDCDRGLHRRIVGAL